MDTKKITDVAFDIVKNLKGQTYKKRYEIEGVKDQYTALEIFEEIFKILKENGFGDFKRLMITPFVSIEELRLPFAVSGDKLKFLYGDIFPKEGNGIIMLFDPDIYKTNVRRLLDNISNDLDDGYKLPPNWFVITFPELPY